MPSTGKIGVIIDRPNTEIYTQGRADERADIVSSLEKYKAKWLEVAEEFGNEQAANYVRAAIILIDKIKQGKT